MPNKTKFAFSGKQPGFTLMEILIVLTLFIFIAGFALIVSLDSYKSNNFKSDQGQLLGVLLKARSQAMANINQKPHGVFMDQTNSQLTLFQGSAYLGRPATDTQLDQVFSGNAAYSLGGATSTIFSQLSGTTTPTSITLDDHIHSKYTICINNEGQINATSTCP